MARLVSRISMKNFKHPVERVHGMTPDKFYERYLLGSGKPAIVTDALDTWPARSKWSFDYFKSNYGSSNVVAQTFSGATLVNKRMNLGDYIDYADAPGDPVAGSAYVPSVASQATPLYLYSLLSKITPDT